MFYYFVIKIIFCLFCYLITFKVFELSVKKKCRRIRNGYKTRGTCVWFAPYLLVIIEIMFRIGTERKIPIHDYSDFYILIILGCFFGIILNYIAFGSFRFDEEYLYVTKIPWIKRKIPLKELKEKKSVIKPFYSVEGVVFLTQEGYYVDEVLYEFEEEKFFDDTFSMMMPTSFKDIDEELMKLKFQSENRPKIIKTSSDDSITIGLTNTTTTLTSTALSQTVRMIKQSIKQCQPANIFYDKKCEKLDDIEFGWCDFKGYAIGGQIYYVNAFVIVGGKMYHVSFSAPFHMMTEWKPIFLDMLRSMKDLTKDNKQNP